MGGGVGKGMGGGSADLKTPDVPVIVSILSHMYVILNYDFFYEVECQRLSFHFDSFHTSLTSERE